MAPREFQPTDRPPEGLDGPDGAWAEHYDSAHVRAQVERVMPALTLVRGTAEVSTVDQVVHEVCLMMDALRAYDGPVTANSGGLRVAKQYVGGNENYEICVVASTVYGFQVRIEDVSAERRGAGRRGREGR